MQQKAKILIIYTGGTIGMIQDAHTGQLKAFDFNHLSAQIPELKQLNVDLASHSFEQAIDSSEIQIKDWQYLAQLIFEEFTNYDGFVILHGSDTMAFTGSALSFMLQGLTKPVILTGSQLPIGKIRTDGKENIITAIEIAADKNKDGSAKVQEVAIYFEYSLYRANRTSKVSASQFEAFKSPNYPELAVAGVQINYRLPEYCPQKLELKDNFSDKVALIKIYPNIKMDFYAAIFDVSKVEGIVLETFGSGNAPSDKTFQTILKTYIENGGIVLNITQCNTGKVVQGQYETSSFFEKVGVIGGEDLTSEAAITKMMHVLANFNTIESRKKALKNNISGELSLQ